MATAGLDFFRVNRSRATRGLLVVAAVLVTTGATSIGAHLVRRLGSDVAHTVTLLGALTVSAGLILGFGAMAMLLFENAYVLLREDGVLCHENGKETLLLWSELERVSLDEQEDVVVFHRIGGDTVRWFAGKDARQLSDRAQEAKRKALHGLLRARELVSAGAYVSR